MRQTNSVIPAPLNSRMNIPILCTLLFIYVTFSQALDSGPYVFKENEKDVVVEMVVPEFPRDVPLITIGYRNENEENKILFLVRKNLEQKVYAAYEDIISTEYTSDRKLRIKFTVMKQTFAQDYKCFPTTTNNAIDNCGFKIIVLGKPSQPEITISKVNSLLVGGSAVLDCEFESRTMPADHGLKPTIRWWDGNGKDQTEWTSRAVVLSNGSLVLPDVDRSDRGTIFVCVAADDPCQDRVSPVFSEPSPEFRIIPEFPPGDNDFTIKPAVENNTVLERAENSALRYECSVNCQPVCKVGWKKKAYGSNRYVATQSVDPLILDLKSVSRSDQGSFICEGENKHGRNNKGFIVEVLYILTPEVLVAGTNRWKETVMEGEMKEVTVTCNVDSNPKPNVLWKNPENWLINQSSFSGPALLISNNSLLLHRYTSNITLRDLKCEDGGSYKCQAQNDLDIRRTGQVDIEVKCRPSEVKVGQYPGLDENLVLKKEYVWDLGRTLRASFVIRGWPSPKVQKILSIKDGQTQEESLQTSISVNTQHPYMQRQYLTLFSFQSQKQLTLEDRGRKFKIILENSDFLSTFEFTIQPRGPPLPVSSMNVTEISHNAVTISWVPEFDGGEAQTFSIYIREKEDDSSSSSSSSSSSAGSVIWNLVAFGLEESSNGEGFETHRVKSLSASTSYEIRVMSVNSRGNTSSSFAFSTKASPASSANTGAIVGGVFAVIIILIIIGIVLFYFLVYKKRWGKGGDGESRIPMIGRMSKMFRGKNKSDPNGNVGSGSDSKKSRFRPPIFTGKSKSKPPKDYLNVPTESTDPTDADTEYMNADAIPHKQPVDSSPDDLMHGGKEDDRVITDDGLTYVKVDFRGKPPPKPKRMESLDTSASGEKGDGEVDTCQYSAIDFDKTKAREEMKRLEEEEVKRKKEEEEEEMRRRETQEDHYANFPSYGTTV